MKAIQTYTESSFVLAVVGAALIYPPLALIVGAGYLIALAYLNDKRSVPESTTE